MASINKQNRARRTAREPARLLAYRMTRRWPFCRSALAHHLARAEYLRQTGFAPRVFACFLPHF